MNKVWQRAAIMGGLIMALAASECGSSSNRERKAVESQQNIYATAQPVPAFPFSLERDIVIQLYKARNQEVATHTVWRSDMGMVEGDCPSVGYPVPYDTSLTNPLMRANIGSKVVLEQPEPNGIFASKNSIATWVRCVVVQDGISRQVPIYIESRVTAYAYPVAVDYDTNRVTAAGAPTLTIEQRGQ